MWFTRNSSTIIFLMILHRQFYNQKNVVLYCVSIFLLSPPKTMQLSLRQAWIMSIVQLLKPLQTRTKEKTLPSLLNFFFFQALNFSQVIQGLLLLLKNNIAYFYSSDYKSATLSYLHKPRNTLRPQDTTSTHIHDLLTCWSVALVYTWGLVFETRKKELIHGSEKEYINNFKQQNLQTYLPF